LRNFAGSLPSWAADEAYRQQRLRLNTLKPPATRAWSLHAALQNEAVYVRQARAGDAKKIMSANMQVERKRICGHLAQ
jgi:hypothetical protein